MTLDLFEGLTLLLKRIVLKAQKFVADVFVIDWVKRSHGIVDTRYVQTIVVYRRLIKTLKSIGRLRLGNLLHELVDPPFLIV